MSSETVMAGMFDCRDAYTSELERLAAADARIVTVVNDSVGSSKLAGFRGKFPDRLINVGIAEQNMVGVAAGLANAGKIPFVSGASCFLTARAMEQIKADVAYSRTNVKLCGMSSGVAYGELGPTHHSIEDIGWLRTMGGIVILVPADPWETREAIRAAAGYDGPVFVRVSRMQVPEIPRKPGAAFEIGKAEILHEGDDMAILANGVLVHRALEAARELAQKGIGARVLNISTISPLDEDAILACAKTGAIVTAEEHSIRGGLAGAVAELTAAHHPCRIRSLGFPGFVPTGSAEWLLKHYNLTARGIVSAALDLKSR